MVSMQPSRYSRTSHNKCASTTGQHATCTQRQCNRSKSAHNPGVRRHSANTHLQPVSTQPTIKDIATARRQHATHAVGCHTTNAHPLLVSTQPAHRGNAIARRQHTTLALGRTTHSAHLYQMSGRHDMRTKPCQDASTPQPVSTQPAPNGDAS